ncbi:response regulator transcription factor [Phenylobacterium sp.]|uniref:helix-turn-helix transcriptional regulator n=1 Tax=Phenylobacterium sp. TaxID=1871053 RepID=UPI002898452F|nr:response regulator transcription factor [Phenylobacterium sp.]
MRVVVVSRQPLWRDALSALVTAQLPTDTVLALDDIAQVQAIEPRDDDLILLDPPPEIDPGDWVEHNAAQLTAGRLALLAPHKNIRWAKIAYAHRFRALLPKDMASDLMLAVLRLVIVGGEYFPCFEELGAIPDPVPGHGPRLSPRQLEVLRELERGRTNKEIAQQLGIAIATVKLHVQAILSATGARNRTEVVSRLASGLSRR